MIKKQFLRWLSSKGRLNAVNKKLKNINEEIYRNDYYLYCANCKNNVPDTILYLKIVLSLL